MTASRRNRREVLRVTYMNEARKLMLRSNRDTIRFYPRVDAFDYSKFDLRLSVKTR